ncbi:hypothetical protein SAMD00023353_12500070 [Rosellinia necatrix]|uniref:Uncharacterized protein n=1 Tax=Rosellinia necatrix TaxID=77044 RepID=A0A1S8ABA5_ROSNE|nr:hypothetical protein SAMD00023353_12500070 [Rosellinia necatrix]
MKMGVCIISMRIGSVCTGLVQHAWQSMKRGLFRYQRRKWEYRRRIQCKRDDMACSPPSGKRPPSPDGCADTVE